VKRQVEQTRRSASEALKSDRARRQHAEIRDGQSEPAEDHGEDRRPPVSYVDDKLLPRDCGDGVDVHLFPPPQRIDRPGEQQPCTECAAANRVEFERAAPPGWE